jgi:CheY-like chemotaxis protein
VRVLLADGDAARLKSLAEACAARGHVVDRATHGPAALEIALERLPDVIVCPIDLPIIDGSRLSEILRANPRTRGASLVFLVEDELDAPLSLDLRDRIVVAPWHESDVLEQLDAILERERRTDPGKRDAELEGKLSQISLVDLLQMLHLSRKSGTLELSPEGSGERAVVQLAEGHISDASLPLRDGTRIGGEKALFRLLALRQGHFSFVPGRRPARARITEPTRTLLLEGMRQQDEWKQLEGRVPGPETALVFKTPRRELESRAQPLMREVLAAIETYRRIGEILDRCPVPDAQVMRVVAELLRRGALTVDTTRVDAGAAGAGAGEGIFSAAQRRRLREWAGAQVPSLGPTLKALIVPASPQLMPAFTSALRECSDFVAESARGRESVAVRTLGHFGLGDDLHLRLLALSPDVRVAPAWEVAAFGMVGAVVLLGIPLAPSLAAVERAIAVLSAGGRPVRHVVESASSTPTLGDAERSELERAGGGPLFVLAGDADAERLATLRHVFAGIVP